MEFLSFSFRAVYGGTREVEGLTWGLYRFRLMEGDTLDGVSSWVLGLLFLRLQGMVLRDSIPVRGGETLYICPAWAQKSL